MPSKVLPCCSRSASGSALPTGRSHSRSGGGNVSRWLLGGPIAPRRALSTSRRLTSSIHQISPTPTPNPQAIPTLVAELRGSGDDPTYRIAFAMSRRPDPRAQLAASDDLSEADIAQIRWRLERLDRASSHGPWTRETLVLISEHPERRAGDLAEQAGRERAPFKLDVRKLKNLGLTESLPVGYRLSPRGRAYLAESGDQI